MEGFGGGVGVNEKGVAYEGRFWGIDFGVRRVQGWKERARNRKK